MGVDQLNVQALGASKPLSAVKPPRIDPIPSPIAGIIANMPTVEMARITRTTMSDKIHARFKKA
ncbi:MAG: hypothetical protein E6K13_10070 [Methanobacteriota archaeon]|nr:MAG: hypothetical protein E6K13_10070 [Euryarchaeota archaeon]